MVYLPCPQHISYWYNLFSMLNSFGDWLPCDLLPSTVCLLFYVLATSKLISGWVPTCDSAHSLWLMSRPPPRNQVACILTWYPSQSHYPAIEPFPYPSNSERLAMKRQLYILYAIGLTRYGFEPTISRTRGARSTDLTTAPSAFCTDIHCTVIWISWYHNYHSWWFDTPKPSNDCILHCFWG